MVLGAAELAERFGLGRAVGLSDGPVARGRQGAVWRLTTTDGVWAVKVLFQESSEDAVSTSTRFQEAACAAGIPAPAIRRTTDGLVFARVGGHQVRMYGWVDLGEPRLDVDPGPIGATVAALHQVRMTAGGPPDPWYTEPIGAAGWDGLITRLSAGGAPFADRLAGLRDELVALESWLEPPTTLQICHCDLWVSNLPPATGGGVCVIDWENSGPADPSHELACVLFEFGRSDPGRARALMSAYKAAGGPGTVTRPGHFTMLIAQLGHIAQIAGTDWLEPNARNPHRSGSEAWIGELLDEPHTRAVLAALRTDVAAFGYPVDRP